MKKKMGLLTGIVIVLFILPVQSHVSAAEFTGLNYWKVDSKMVGIETMVVQWTKPYLMLDEIKTIPAGYFIAWWINSEERAIYSFEVTLTSGSNISFFLLEETEYTKYANGLASTAIIVQDQVGSVDVSWTGDGSRVYAVYSNTYSETTSKTCKILITILPPNENEVEDHEVRLDGFLGDEGVFKVIQGESGETRIINMNTGKNDSNYQFYYFYNWEKLLPNKTLEYNLGGQLFYFDHEANASLGIKVNGNMTDVPVMQFKREVTLEQGGLTIAGTFSMSMATYSGTLLRKAFIGKYTIDNEEYANFSTALNITEVTDVQVIDLGWPAWSEGSDKDELFPGFDFGLAILVLAIVAGTMLKKKRR
ncbi:MAG: hypothetical protein ACFFB3_16765 [Candidatus Hodarchaeota archaeon]